MRRTLPLALQLLVLQALIVIGTVLVAGLVAVRLEQNSIRDTYSDRVLTIARSLAAGPGVQQAYADDEPSATLQPLAELVRQAAGATFVVFTDADGRRYSHPDQARIGERVSTDPDVPLSGAEFVGTEQGTLGESLRAKVPVRDAAGEVQGTVSVGILESRLTQDLSDVVRSLATWLALAALLGVLGAAGVARLVRRRIFGLEPEQIADLLKTREAMLHGIREGVVATDGRGRVALVNDEAMRLLALDDDPVGRPAASVVEAELLTLLDEGRGPVTNHLVLEGERVLVANATTARVGGRDVGRVLTLRDRTELFDALRALQGQRSITDALRAQAHEFSNHLHVLSGLIDLGRHDEAVQLIGRLGGGSTLGGTSLRGIEDASVAALLLAKAAAARERGVAVRLDPASELAGGAGDDVLTIVGNLVDNAVDAAGPGGEVAVSLEGALPGHGITIRVSDDGPGVPTGWRERIFEIGETTKEPTPDNRGHGIGLALVSRIVRRRGGRTHVGDAADGGAVFTVTLPPPSTSDTSSRNGSRSSEALVDVTAGES